MGDQPHDELAGEWTSTNTATLRERVARLEQLLALRKRETHALRERETEFLRAKTDQQRLVALVENSSDFIGMATMDGTPFFINEAGRRLVGLEEDEFKRTKITGYFSPEDVPRLVQEVLPAVMSHGRWAGELRFRHFKTGGTIPVYYNIFPILDDAGQPIALATVTGDLRERKLAEEERERLKDELIRLQAATLLELSTPLLRISEHAMVMPLIGAMDAKRADAVIDRLLQGVGAIGARVVILDITGVSDMDTHVADTLIRAARSVRLLGAHMVLTGIGPEVARILVGLGVDLAGIVTLSSLESGIAFAMEQR